MKVIEVEPSTGQTIGMHAFGASSEVVTIDRGTLEHMLPAEPRLAANLIWPMTGHLRRREDPVRRLIMRHPSQRLAAQLIELADVLGEPARKPAVCPRLSHEVLADLLGLRRETVTLHLARLRRMGAMRVAPDRFTLDVDLLAAVPGGVTPAAAGSRPAKGRARLPGVLTPAPGSLRTLSGPGRSDRPDADASAGCRPAQDVLGRVDAPAANA